MAFLDFLQDSFRRLGFLILGFIVILFGASFLLAGSSGGSMILIFIGLFIVFVGMAMIAYARS